jgi:glucose-6-phosphate-specific signal transduction histidine kinase
MAKDFPTGTLLRVGQDNGQGLDILQPWRIDGIQGFQESVEAIGDFCQLRVLDL